MASKTLTQARDAVTIKFDPTDILYGIGLNNIAKLQLQLGEFDLARVVEQFFDRTLDVHQLRIDQIELVERAVFETDRYVVVGDVTLPPEGYQSRFSDSLNRGDLTVFVHPNTGQDLEDHRDHAIWLGQQVPLVLDIFTKRKDS